MIALQVTVAGLDVSCDAVEWSMSWGRTSLDSQPDTREATVVLRDPAGAYAARFTDGDPVTVTALVNGNPVPRFAGTVLDMTLTPSAGRLELVAAGPLGALGRTVVGDEPWPVESDIDRINRILGLAGWDTGGPTWADLDDTSWAASDDRSWQECDPLTPAGSSGWLVTARDVDAQPAAKLMAEVATSTGSVLTETHDGQVVYLPPTARSLVPAVTVTACDLPQSGVVWDRTTDGVINTVEVEYGPDGDRHRAVARNQPSLDRRGPFPLRLDSQLELFTDAQTLAYRTMSARFEPEWAASGLRVDTGAYLTPPGTLVDVLTLDTGTTWKVVDVGPPAPPTAAAGLLLIVEGGREAWQATPTGVTVAADLVCTDAILSVGGGPWSAVPDDLVWSAVDPGTTWITADDIIPTVEGQPV